MIGDARRTQLSEQLRKFSSSKARILLVQTKKLAFLLDVYLAETARFARAQMDSTLEGLLMQLTTLDSMECLTSR